LILKILDLLIKFLQSTLNTYEVLFLRILLGIVSFSSLFSFDYYKRLLITPVVVASDGEDENNCQLISLIPKFASPVIF